jgi:predicted nucleic acid-binding protein
MPDDLPKFYWDSCVFISYINAMAERLPHIDWFLDNSGKVHQIVTSTLSVAEVAFAEIEKRGAALSDDVVNRIDALWLSDDSPVRLAEPHLDIMLDARDLARRARAAGWSVRGADAIHMATAKRLGAAEIHTYSTDWPRNQELLGIPIHPPICPTPMLPFPSDSALADPHWISVEKWPALWPPWREVSSGLGGG